ncbi:unnamed protein product [Polarella glacialis]|uniref:Potassium channel tetramerisation-type BTB domain-containing protein n=1 Tax=Polarella glacialis TaxID=89957 RepID=A0A813FKR9_POLGL|nr:unnamed protein product [Polarella glacialis]
MEMEAIEVVVGGGENVDYGLEGEGVSMPLSESQGDAPLQSQGQVRVASSSNSLRVLEHATLEELASALTTQLAKDKERAALQLVEANAAEKRLEEKRSKLEELEHRIFAVADGVDDVVELNVGGQLMSTTRAVLRSAEGSLLAGMFSGNFDSGHKRDKEGRIFLDIDPPLFSKVLSHLRLRRIASPDCPAPLPHIAEELQPEYDMMIKYFGLETFMYGDTGTTGNIFFKIAELAGVEQSKLQTHDLVKLSLSSTGGVPASSHEEVVGMAGFCERSLENSYGARPNSVTVKFLKHRVRIEGMELRAKVADVLAHMSNQWTFRHGAGHGTEIINMSYAFSRLEPCTARLETPGFGPSFVDEVSWIFPRDFCLEHIMLYGRVTSKS